MRQAGDGRKNIVSFRFQHVMKVGTLRRDRYQHRVHFRISSKLL